MEAEILFKERQQFRQWWLWILISLVTLITGVSPFVALQQGEAGWPVLLLLIFPILLIALFASMRLDTEIKANGIYVRLLPFQYRYKQYSWDQIERLFVRQYEPLKEYGGWGVRGIGSNRALNTSGNQGLQLILKDGKKLLIGTQRPDELASLIASFPLLQS